jgi:phosphatidylserine decarboxylase
VPRENFPLACAPEALTPVLRHVLTPIHPDGWRFIAIAAVVTLVFFWLWAPLGWLGLLVTLWCVYFFRDPWRVTPTRDGLVVAPADGLVVSVGPAMPPPELEMGAAPMTRIGIFLNVFDVHINRMPMSGRILKLAYHAGKFLNASLDKASDENERMAIRVATSEGPEIAVVQIAGLVARRIVCNLSAGQDAIAGQRFGLIRFGSRTDVYLPPSWPPLVIPGQRVLGGETVIADARAQEPPRRGITH